MMKEKIYLFKKVVFCCNKLSQILIISALILCVNVRAADQDDNDGLDAVNEKGQHQMGLFSKADTAVYKNMPPELKDIHLQSKHIEIMSDDYNMGDWQESPSKIIFHDGYYHIWIIDIPQGKRKRPKTNSVTRYLKSRDGILWLDQGLLPLGQKGSIDDAQRLAPDVVKYNGRFYLFYEPMTINIEKYRQRRCGIACLVADQPQGPWEYATEELLLTPSMRFIGLKTVLNLLKLKHLVKKTKWGL